MNINIGTKLKRRFHDFATVEIIDIEKDHVVIADNGSTFHVSKAKVEEYFEEIHEKEFIKQEQREPEVNNNVDDCKRHNINTANRPSDTQKKAFEDENQ